jgi:1,4-dihydroxy-6-naphthoate synthase
VGGKVNADSVNLITRNSCQTGNHVVHRTNGDREKQQGEVTLQIGHSPDPDDAFMWYPLTGIDGGEPFIDTGRYHFTADPLDIESLNQRAERSGDLEITAISVAQFPFVADQYVITACGASMGEGYGPKLVAREQLSLDDLRNGERRVAIPGERTSAYLAFRLMLGMGLPNCEVVAFESIIDRVAGGEFDAGLVIHEGQLTFEQSGLVLIRDLGAWWTGETGLPLPLGANTIRRDLDDLHGPGTLLEICRLLESSVRFAMAHREQGLDYALQFGRGLERGLADEFVTMYVNERTLDLGATGREAIERFLNAAADSGLVPAIAGEKIIVSE